MDVYFKHESEEEYIKKGRTKGHYPYVPLNRKELYNMLYATKEKLIEENTWSHHGRDNWNTRPILLDVGCGIGTTLLIANALGFATRGIEYNKELVEVAKKLVSLTYGEVGRIDHIDALEFKEYNKVDVIYYYCPIENSKLQCKLEDKIEKDMKKGAYLIPIMKQDNKIEKNKNFKHIPLEVKETGYRFSIYKKIK